MPKLAKSVCHPPPLCFAFCDVFHGQSSSLCSIQCMWGVSSLQNIQSPSIKEGLKITGMFLLLDVCLVLPFFSLFFLSNKGSSASHRYCSLIPSRYFRIFSSEIALGCSSVIKRGLSCEQKSQSFTCSSYFSKFDISSSHCYSEYLSRTSYRCSY